MKGDKEILINKIVDSIEGYFLLGMYDEAKEEVKNLFAIDNNNVFGHYYEGLIWLEQKDYKQALRPFLRVSELKPDMAEVYVHLAYIYRRTENLNKAIETIKKALFSNPNLAIAHYNLSCYYAQLGKIEEVISHLKKAISRDKNYIEMAKDDNDFEPVKRHNKFRKLIYRK